MTISTLYRPGVGIILTNKDHKVFMGMRVDNPEDAWQMPQGGIDEGEAPDVAMLRELEEEVGTCNVEIICTSDKWYRYDFPPHLQTRLWGGKYKGQEQLWYVVSLKGDDSQINIHTPKPEFRQWKWVAPRDVLSLIVPFKRQLYTDVLKDLWPFE